MEKEKKELITEDIKSALKEAFKDLSNEVLIEVYTKIGVNDMFNDLSVDLVQAMAEANSKINVKLYRLESENARQRNVLRSPTILIAPDKYNIRFTGAPLGEEGRSLVLSIMMASTGQTPVSPDTKKRFQRVKEKRHVKVFVSPTCPYCPQQVMYAVSAAIERKDLVSTEVIEIYENKDLAEKYSAMSVPQTYIGETHISAGLQPEEYFAEALVEGKPVEYIMPSGREELRDYDIVIIGAGPAGLTASLYAERSGLKSIIFERANVGGQIAITPIVDNYPGFASIAGKTLVDLMAKQTMEYSSILQGVGVQDIKKKDSGFEISTGMGTYKAKAIVIATGAGSKKMNATGEDRLAGRGVSYCATCDGYFFKDGKNVLVVGGGNSALTDALYLESLGAHVTIIHRREAFRAEDRLQQSVFQRNIPVIWNSVVKEVLGDKAVEKVQVEDTKTHKTNTVKADAVFIAIGYEPHNEIAVKLDLEIDGEGYVKVDDKMRTSMPMVYAAGDITGGVKQIVTAVSQGAVAALTAFEDIANPYWKKKEAK